MKRYREWNPTQSLLMPPSPGDWLKSDHLVYFLLEVLDSLDLSEIHREIQSKDSRGNRPYSPRMMVGLLLYGYCVGKVSSRKLERATYEEVPFVVLAGGHHPDHSAISEFRQRHLEVLGGLFMQVLDLCRTAGLVKMGHVALDGTKMKANASRHKAGSYAGMTRSEERIASEIEEMLKRAEAADAEEDERFGKDRTGDELPDGLRTRAERLRKIQEAKQALEADAALTKALEKKKRAAEKAAKAESSGTNATEAAAKAAAEEASRHARTAMELAEQRLETAQERTEELSASADDAKGRRAATQASHDEERVARDLAQARSDLEMDESGTDKVAAEVSAGKDTTAPGTELPSRRTKAERDGSPAPKAQRNYTDPDSHLMKSGTGYEQAYNCQAAVDEEHQIIVAAVLTNQSSDAPHLAPMLDAVINNCGAVPTTFTADAGYSSEANLAHCEDVGTDAYIPSSRKRQPEPAPAASPSPSQPTRDKSVSRIEGMRAKVSSEEGRRKYGRRKWVAEAPFGQIKAARGLRQLLMRGIEKARDEWSLICAGHNLLKLYRATRG